MNAQSLAIAVACLLAASCASDPGSRDSNAARSDRNAGNAFVGNALNSDTRGPAAPSVNSGDGTPAIGTGVGGQSDSALGFQPGFPVTR
jgi:hypothetical protein